jgi:uncharacterized protein (DUF1697 family)
VGGTGIIRMAALKALCDDLGFNGATTLLQSGNVVFRAKGSERTVAKKLADAIAASHGFRPEVAVRTTAGLAAAIAGNPFPVEAAGDPSHVLIAFTEAPPDDEAAGRIAAVKVDRERLVLRGGELYIHYAAGIGRSKVTNAVLERALGVPATARNWNTVSRLLEMAKSLEADGP